MSTSSLKLDKYSSLFNYKKFIKQLASESNLLIIQDLDGVCMELVKEPSARTIDKKYVEAVQIFKDHFYVLTNGEHIGKNGVNFIIEKAYQNKIKLVKDKKLYLPGLAAGSAQWQESNGDVTYPGVSEKELFFLASVPEYIQKNFIKFFSKNNFNLSEETIRKSIKKTVLYNKVSPTVNLNILYDLLSQQTDNYIKLQKFTYQLMYKLLKKAQQEDLYNSFSIHCTANLGKDEQGQEIIQFAKDKSSGTTDFQFMLKDATKEAGVLLILNNYMYKKTGDYPLGKDFNFKQVPTTRQEILSLIRDHFNPSYIPTIIGVGDTVTNEIIESCGKFSCVRGGSDRNFLELIQLIGERFNKRNIIAYVNSSTGEVRNHKALKISSHNSKNITINGMDKLQDDPLKLNIVFSKGYQQYINCFKKASRIRKNFLKIYK
ncbi:MAG: glucosylglycerol 3-phosphatase [Candidatus Atelocyanobacterium thalassa]|uniref:Glucosylglycerol phosphatase n=1 Tax=Candidatus Atelocyanobacterium thalassa isolate SIO64986 TaxID=1527444 RepID=A0A086CIW7_9CHRO|nr:MAG: glucosylglycerol phosphatase [Candidatus Atelocyanobacterium thalassa isolate SIO64986]